MALRNIGDLFEMLPASASIQGPLSIGFPHGSFRSTFRIYERALVIACPILLLFAHHCVISAERSPTFRLLASRKLPILNTGLRFSKNWRVAHGDRAAAVWALPRSDVTSKVRGSRNKSCERFHCFAPLRCSGCWTGSDRAIQTEERRVNQVLTKVGLSGIGHSGARVLAYGQP